jgi:hypothetical protein
VSASPAAALSSELMTFSTPGGRSVCSCATLAMKAPVSGVSGAVFRTMVLPVASVCWIFQMSVMNGAFHGVIAPTTPYGS